MPVFVGIRCYASLIQRFLYASNSYSSHDNDYVRVTLMLVAYRGCSYKDVTCLAIYVPSVFLQSVFCKVSRCACVPILLDVGGQSIRQIVYNFLLHSFQQSIDCKFLFLFEKFNCV